MVYTIDTHGDMPDICVRIRKKECVVWSGFVSFYVDLKPILYRSHYYMYKKTITKRICNK